jgi:hypothetical protein
MMAVHLVVALPMDVAHLRNFGPPHGFDSGGWVNIIPAECITRR